MKNKQREIPSPSYAEPKHIFLIAHKRWYYDHLQEAHYTYKTCPYKPIFFYKAFFMCKEVATECCVTNVKPYVRYILV
jgi:hypothetical protein